MSDDSGNWPKWIKKAAGWVNKNIVQPVKKKANEVKSAILSTPILNNVAKIHDTKPVATLDFGYLLGEVGVSITQKHQDQETALMYSYTDVGIDEAKYGAGVNLFGWIGVEHGVSSDLNYFTGVQLTPKLHCEVSRGLDGVGITCSFDSPNLSIDFETRIGLGFLGLFFFPQSAATYGELIPVLIG